MDAAGKSKDNSAASCLQEPSDPLSTPDRVRAQSPASCKPPGECSVHLGRLDDPVPSARFGVRTSKSESAEDVLHTEPSSELLQRQKNNAELVYQSCHFMPLGRARSRGHNVPTDSRFGAPSENSNKPPHETSAKEVIYPVHSDSHCQPVSHERVPPGTQRTRNYDWHSAGIDPQQIRFGKASSRKVESTADVLQRPEGGCKHGAPARIVSKHLHDIQLATKDRLGRSQRQPAHEQVADEEGADPPAGVPSVREHEFGVYELLTGGVSPEQQQPDETLGRQVPSAATLAEWERNQVFGKPTVRTDVPAPTRRSVANDQNYGDEPGAESIVFPGNCFERGALDEEFSKPLSLKRIKEIYSHAGCEVDDKEFEVLVQKGAEAEGRKDETCSLGTFQKLRASHQRLRADST